LNVDLTASRKFGDWEFGLVAFGSTDLNSPVDGYLKQSQIAVGGLIGRALARSSCKPILLQTCMRNTAAATHVYGGVSSSRSETAHSDKHAGSTERGETIPPDRIWTLHGRRKWGTASERANLLRPSGVTTTKAAQTIGAIPYRVYAARQGAQLPRLTVHWLSVTRDN
jgi:hypothetical protein